jgi:hypothetical protein
MEKYRNLIFDVDQENAERWNWKIFSQIGERALVAGTEKPLKAARLAIDDWLGKAAN